MPVSIDEQVEQLMQKTQFGDHETQHVMAQALRARLAEGRPLCVYLGVDPTAPDLHLGHAVPLQKLALFQQLGHTCILLIGDFTARIGDPSDKDQTRPQLTSAQIEANVKTYRDQAFKILDPARTTICYNSTWHGELTFEDVIRLAGQFTVAQFLERDNFAKRFTRGEGIYLHEFFYALMQGYDAFALKADVQLGGTDQTFNILAGRRLQETWDQQPQVMLTNPMLPGTDGQHSFYQLIHQGTTVVPLEFIGFLQTQHNSDVLYRGSNCQEKLLSNLIAQSIGLATGQHSDNPNKDFVGNRPNRVLLADRLDAFTLGMILSYYEHKVAFQGFIWDINSFDQEGVQLGKVLALKMIDQFIAAREGKPIDEKGFPLGAAYFKHLY